MKRNKPFSLSERVKSFKNAIQGLIGFLMTEHNAWLHLLATVIVIVVAIVLKISNTDWIALVFSIGLVWVAELFNTAIEKIMDFISVEDQPRIKFIKDIAAAAVLVAAIIAIIVGCFVFIPKI